MAEWHSDEELRTLAGGPEGELVEWKNGFDDVGSKSLRKSVCAFANDLPGHNKPGVIFVGVRDDGSLSGAEINDGLMKNLADIRDDPKFSAPLRLRPLRLSHKGGETAALQVMPFPSPPMRYDRKVYVRIGPTSREANEVDLQALNERRRHRDIFPDIRPVETADLGDLNLPYFQEEYLPATVDAETLLANDRAITAQLAAAKMIARDDGDRSVPTVLGLLVLGRQTRDFLPGAYVQFLRIDSGELDSDPVDEEAISGTIPEIARRLREKLRAHNRVRVEYVNAPLEKRHWMYPETALLQVAHNAMMHRRYEGTNAPVRVYWFNDRIEIDNPGGLHGEVRARKGAFPDAGCDYRNPNLAEAMKALGLVQKFGSGLGLARQELEKNGNPPMEWDRDALEVHVRCILRPASLGGEFRLSSKTIVSLAQFLHMFGNPGYQLLRKHGVVARPAGGGIETMLEQAEANQLRGVLDEIGRTRMALRRQMTDWAVEKERRESKDADPETYGRRLEESRETAEAAFAERLEDLQFCLRGDGFRFRNEGEKGENGVIPV